MPKIVIREHDNTSSPSSLNGTENVIYIPGLLNNSTAESNISAKYYSKIKDFEGDASLYDTNDLSYKLARHAFNLGFEVVYQGINNSSELDKSDLWAGLKDNKNNYPIRFLTLGGFPVTDSANYSANFSSAYSQMISCAESRGDCIGLVDYIGNSSDYSNVSIIREFFEEAKSGGSSYAAGFVPNFETKGKDFEWKQTDPNNASATINRYTIPASFGYLFSYGRMIQNNPEWLAVAGSQRGNIAELNTLPYYYNEADIEQLQARATTGEVDLDDETGDNVGIAINPIATIRPYGNIIWGNRTLLSNTLGEGLKATSFLNIRNLICTVKKALYTASKKYTFDQNGDVLWINFSNEITPLLERMKSGNGILAYRLDRVKTDKKARLAAKLSIIPIEGVEDFEFDIYLEDSLEVSEQS